MWIDSHCHLNHPNIKDLGTPQEIADGAFQQGVSGLVTISCRISEEYEVLRSIAANDERIWCTIGTHPHDAGVDAEKAISEDQLVQMALADKNIIGIGETGLDYFYDNSPREDQVQSFRKHCRAAIRTGLPVIIHARDADDDVAMILEEESDRAKAQGKELRGLMHCFSSGEQLARRALAIGFYVSFSGILTFKKADELRDIAKTIPKDRLLVETDAPFLAPAPNRSKTNTPAYVGLTGERLAELHNMSPDEMASITMQNFFRLFDRAALNQ